MDLLYRIKDAQFPLALHDEADIRNSAVLEAAGLIVARLPPPLRESPDGMPVVIFRITQEGKAALSKAKHQS